MADSRAPSILNGKTAPTLKFVAIIAAAVASAFGTAQIAPNNQAAESAQQHAVRADEKADLAYQLLNQKVDYENKALNSRIDTLESQLRVMDRKLDRLARGRSASFVESGESAPEEPAVAPAPKPEPETRVAIPSSLDAAYAKKKSGDLQMGAASL